MSEKKAGQVSPILVNQMKEKKKVGTNQWNEEQAGQGHSWL